MTLGLTVGKFYPFHLGHDHLIRTAKGQVDHLVVLVGFKPDHRIPGSVRADWIRSLHPEVEVIEVLDDIPNAPEPWCRRALEVLDGRRPDLVFTSETYGDPWAELLGARHCAVDIERTTWPVSGTLLRQDLGSHWHLLTPPARAWLARRVCVVGVESSGTTTLAEALAAHYKTVWVPEYGRWYWEGRRYSPNSDRWDSDELVRIARGQVAWEDDLAHRANRVVICDTDPLATHVWHRRYMGFYSPEVEQIADRRRYDLYILTQPDFGFVQDGTRDGEHIRLEMHDWLVEILRTKRRRFVTVGGPPGERLAEAVRQIDPLLAFPPLDEP